MELLNILVYLLGSFFVVIFALSFFNTSPGFRPDDKGVEEILKIDPELQPALPKYATERTRYNLFAWVFVCLTLLLYFFVSFIFPNVVASYTGGENIPVSATGVIVLGTLMFIGLSPKIPYIRELLDEYKKNLYEKAQIPEKGLAVFRHLMYGELNLDSEVFNKNLSVILSDECKHNFKDSLDKDYFSYEKNKIERKWARLTYLIYCLEEWGKKEPFRRHIDSSALRWLPIKELVVEKLLPEMIKYKKGKILTDKDKEQLKNELHQTLVRVYWLVTLLLFMSSKSGEVPSVHLKDIGWVIDPDRYFKFSMNHVIFSGSLVLFSIIIGATISAGLLFAAKENGYITNVAVIDSKVLFRWVLLGVPMFIFPLFITLTLKRFLSIQNIWEVSRPEKPKVPFSQRPWYIYFLVAIVSYVATFAIQVAILAFIQLPENRDLSNTIAPLAMYTLIAAATSLYVSYLLDTPTPGWEKDYKYYLKSILPAITQGAVNVLIISFCMLYFSEEGGWVLPEQEQSKLLVYSVTAFIIGIAMYMTSRMRSKYYDRRETTRTEDENWLTVNVGDISSRVKSIRESINAVEILANSDLQSIAEIGSEVFFAHKNEKLARGKVTAFNGATMTISPLV